MRYQDANAIGFPIIVNPDSGTRISDVANPHMGPTELKVDLWFRYDRKILKDRVDWTVQLNVRDLLTGDDLIPVTSQPDGSISGYMIERGRFIEVGNTFRF